MVNKKICLDFQLYLKAESSATGIGKAQQGEYNYYCIKTVIRFLLIPVSFQTVCEEYTNGASGSTNTSVLENEEATAGEFPHMVR